MLVLAAAARTVVGAGRIFAAGAGLEDVHDLGARVLGLARDDAHAQPVALGCEGDEDDEALLQARETVAAEDHFFDGDFDEVALSWSGSGGLVHGGSEAN